MNQTCDSVLPAVAANDLVESLLILQNRAGSRTVLSGSSLDEAVEVFFVLKFRRVAQRGATSLQAFFDCLDLGARKYLETNDLHHFMKRVSKDDRENLIAAMAMEGSDIGRSAGGYVRVLDVQRTGRVEL